MWIHSPKRRVDMATVDWRCSQAKNCRSIGIRIPRNAGGQIVIKFFHDTVIWMIIDGVMCLIEYQKADIGAQADVSMAECIK